MSIAKTCIIAEIGANHCGDMELARQLILSARDNGADLVKFQLYSCNGLKRTPETLRELAKSELSFAQFEMLFKYGESIGIEVFASVFDIERVEWCEKVGVRRYKIAGRERDEDVIAALKETKKPVIASISPTYPRPEDWADEFYDIDFLYCPSKYPTPFSSIYLSDIEFPFEYQGFSDHTIGLDATKIATARGARIIEKHFAINHEIGIDALWSMTPAELRELKRWITTVIAMG